MGDRKLILHTVRATWIDPWGNEVKHVDRLIEYETVVKTGRTAESRVDGYTTTPILDPIWVNQNGDEFRQWLNTVDYHGHAHFRRVRDNLFFDDRVPRRLIDMFGHPITDLGVLMEEVSDAETA